MLTQPAPVNPSSHSVTMNGLACGPENVFSRSVTARLLDPPKNSSESTARDAPTSRPTSSASVVQPSKPFSKSPAGRILSPEPTTTSDTSSILKSGISDGSGSDIQLFSKNAQSHSLVEASNS